MQRSLDPSQLPELPQGQPQPRQRAATASGYGDKSGASYQNLPQNHYNHVPPGDQGRYGNAVTQSLNPGVAAKVGYQPPAPAGVRRQFMDPNVTHGAVPPPQARDYYDAPERTGIGPGMNHVGSKIGPGGPEIGLSGPGMSTGGPVMGAGGTGMGHNATGMGAGGTGMGHNATGMGTGGTVMGVGRPGMNGGPGANIGGSEISLAGSGMGSGSSGMGSSSGPLSSRLQPASTTTKRRQPMSMNASDISKFHKSTPLRT